MYKYLFGPVPSRRLGMSLGIDLVPKKVCSLNCVYCEVGETTRLTTERKEYIIYYKIEQELKHYFKNNPDPDYFTFSGSGEPTLNNKIENIILFLKLNKPQIPVAVLTNGTLLYQKQVREELKYADIVLPSLDAVTDPIYKRINRPANDLTTEKHIQGLIDFRNDFKGKIWLEIFILPGYNDSEQDMVNLKQILQKIKADKIQLNTLDRPGLISGLLPAEKSQLQSIAKYLGNSVEIIASPQKRKKINAYKKDIESTIIETLTRRPCTISDLEKMTGMHINEINKYLDVLENDDKIESNRQQRGIFYQLKEK